jgi:hypothetical protein
MQMNERPIVTVVRGCDVIASESNVNDLVNTHGPGSVMIDGVPFNQLNEDDQATARAMPWRDLPTLEAPDPSAEKEKEQFIEKIITLDKNMAETASADAPEPVVITGEFKPENINKTASENASADASVAAKTQPE